MATNNFRPAFDRNPAGVEIIYRPNGKSATINCGDPVVMTTNTTYTTASNPVARTLLAADIAALYLQTAVAGILGFSLQDAVTNSSGIAISQVVYSAKAAAAEPILQSPSYGFGLPPDPNISYTELQIAVAVPGQVFRGKLKTGTASNLSLGLAGIDLTSSVFTVDTGATTKILSVIDWERLPAGGSYVYFEVLPSYCQYLTGVNYTSQ